MRYFGHPNNEIIQATELSKVSIVAHIKNWNAFGLESVQDQRGGNNEPKLTFDISDDLINVALHKTRHDFDFIGYNWTLELLALYIKQNYDIDVSGVTIRTILKANNISYKRAQPKPTKADKTEQEAFKKTEEIINSLEFSSDTIVYAMDETRISIESDNRSSWSPVGDPLVIEKNGSHEGINIIGSTCILNNFHTVNDIYSFGKSITSVEVVPHFEHLISINPGKNIIVFLDNARFHTSISIQEYYLTKKGVLKLIYLPRYSPKMNPQEHIWNYLKSKLFKPSARSCKEELLEDLENILDELNSNPDKISSLAYAKNYLV